MYKSFLKPFFDFSVSLVGLLLLLPLFVGVMSLLFFVNRGSPFFLQARPGRSAKIFNVIKFKTMNDKKDRQGNLLPAPERITAVGAFIRKTSIDEIPQLINVLKGDMSLVGPRPLLVDYLSLYSEEQKRRHEVRPGITGWAQVNGRNAISWEQKFDYDLWYVKHVSFVLDVKILALTLLKVVKKEGIGAEGKETVTKFLGNEYSQN